MSLHQNNGEHIAWLAENKLDGQHPLKPYYDELILPEFGSLPANDDSTTLFYKLYKPNNMAPGKKYPGII